MTGRFIFSQVENDRQLCCPTQVFLVCMHVSDQWEWSRPIIQPRSYWTDWSV